MDKLVQVSEQEVEIDFKLGCKCRAKIHLKSLSKRNPVAFKVQTSAPHKFLVSPPNGLIPPSSSTTFQVILKPQSQPPTPFPRSSTERFLIKTALAPDLEDGNAHSVSSWFSSTNRVTVDIKLKVFYVGTFLLQQALVNDDIEAIKQITRRRRPDLSLLSLNDNLAFFELASSSTNPVVLPLLIEAGLKVDDARVCDTSIIITAPAQSESANKYDSSLLATKGWSQLHWAASTGEDDAIKMLVEDETIARNVDCRDKRSRTPLHLAACKGHPMCVRLLVEAGADKDAKGGDGRTSLICAAADGKAEVVSLLLEMGADPNITVGDNHVLTALDVAHQNGHKDIVEILESGEMMLTAARRGDLNALKLLLQKFPKVNRFDQYGLTALHSAAIKGHAGVITMLTEHGMSMECQDCEGHTPLHLAVESGCLETVKALVERGANVNSKSKRGATPLLLATSMGHDTISKFLLSCGAGPECSLSSSSSLSSCSFS